MPFYLSLFSFLSSALWMIYGLLGRDLFIAVSAGSWLSSQIKWNSIKNDHQSLWCFTYFSWFDAAVSELHRCSNGHPSAGAVLHLQEKRRGSWKAPWHRHRSGEGSESSSSHASAGARWNEAGGGGSEMRVMCMSFFVFWNWRCRTNLNVARIE